MSPRNLEEELAYEYIKSLGYEASYEPNGMRPPDFAIGNEIGIEVRRLNQHVLTNGKLIPVEGYMFNEIRKIENWIAELEYQSSKPSFIYSIHFRRSFKLNKEFFNELEKVCRGVLDTTERSEKIKISEKVEIDFLKVNSDKASNFLFGGTTDRDQCGFPPDHITKALDIVIEEKCQRVNRYRNDYTKWWLILVDFIGFGLRPGESSQLARRKSQCDPFTRVILLDPNNPESGVDIPLSE